MLFGDRLRGGSREDARATKPPRLVDRGLKQKKTLCYISRGFPTLGQSGPIATQLCQKSPMGTQTTPAKFGGLAVAASWPFLPPLLGLGSPWSNSH